VNQMIANMEGGVGGLDINECQLDRPIMRDAPRGGHKKSVNEPNTRTSYSTMWIMKLQLLLRAYEYMLYVANEMTDVL
jgi:hypothetical protein